MAAVVTTFLLLGRYLEANAKQKAGDALKALLNLGAKDATVLRDGSETKIPADQLQVGDVLVVRPGEKIATDGVVIEGTSAVDASLVTGESVPVEVGPDSKVTGATINTSGRLLVRATRVGSETTLAQMARLVSQAQTGKAPIARLADRISAVFVPVVLAIAALDLRGCGCSWPARPSAKPSCARPSPPPSPSWSSPARARWASPPRWGCSPEPAAAPNWASSSKARRCSRTPAPWTPSCWTRPAR